jgi:hypothetical protein
VLRLPRPRFDRRSRYIGGAERRLHEKLPHHSSLTRIRQRWGEERFRRIFKRKVEACLKAKIATAEVVHIDASLIRANVSWGRSSVTLRTC